MSVASRRHTRESVAFETTGSQREMEISQLQMWNQYVTSVFLRGLLSRRAAYGSRQRVPKFFITYMNESLACFYERMK